MKMAYSTLILNWPFGIIQHQCRTTLVPEDSSMQVRWVPRQPDWQTMLHVAPVIRRGRIEPVNRRGAVGETTRHGGGTDFTGWIAGHSMTMKREAQQILIFVSSRSSERPIGSKLLSRSSEIRTCIQLKGSKLSDALEYSFLTNRVPFHLPYFHKRIYRAVPGVSLEGSTICGQGLVPPRQLTNFMTLAFSLQSTRQTPSFGTDLHKDEKHRACRDNRLRTRGPVESKPLAVPYTQ